MKKLILIYTIFLHFNATSQINDIFIPAENYGRGISVLELNNRASDVTTLLGYFEYIRDLLTFTTSDFKITLLKKNNQQIDTLFHVYEPEYRRFCSNLLYFNNEIWWETKRLNLSDSSDSKIIFYIFDQDFSLKDSLIIEFDQAVPGVGSHFIYKDSLLLFQYGYKNLSPGMYLPIFLQIDKFRNYKIQFAPFGSLYRYCGAMVYRIKDGKAYIACHDDHLTKIFDDEMNLVETIELRVHTGQAGTFLSEQNGFVYDSLGNGIVAGLGRGIDFTDPDSSRWYTFPILLRVDENYNILQNGQYRIDTSSFGDEYFPNVNALQKVHGEEAYFIGSEYGRSTKSEAFIEEDYAIALRKVNKNLELEWTVFYWGVSVYLFNMVSTPDGGVIFACGYYDWRNLPPGENYFTSNVYPCFIKFDGSGNPVTSYPTQILPEMPRVKVYGNPVPDFLRLEVEDMPPGMRLELRSLQGNILGSAHLQPGINEMPVSHFVPGIYLYSIYEGNTLRCTGKWVKG